MICKKMRKNEKNITSKMTVKELLDEFPETVSLFIKRKMVCIGCPAEAFASLEDVARSYKIDLNEIMMEIKTMIKKQNGTINKPKEV